MTGRPACCCSIPIRLVIGAPDAAIVMPDVGFIIITIAPLGNEEKLNRAPGWPGAGGGGGGGQVRRWNSRGWTTGELWTCSHERRGGLIFGLLHLRSVLPDDEVVDRKLPRFHMWLQLEAIFQHRLDHQLQLLSRYRPTAAVGLCVDIVPIRVDPTWSSYDLELAAQWHVIRLRITLLEQHPK